MTILYITQKPRDLEPLSDVLKIFPNVIYLTQQGEIPALGYGTKLEEHIKRKLSNFTSKDVLLRSRDNVVASKSFLASAFLLRRPEPQAMLQEIKITGDSWILVEHDLMHLSCV